MEKEQFYMIPKILARADGFISRHTGEAVPLTSSAKLVYTYMLSRNEFFVVKQNSQHYESQSTVADACGLEYKAAGKILRTFTDHKIIEAQKLRPNAEGQWRWFYKKVHTDIDLWEGTKENFEIVKSIPKPDPKMAPPQPTAAKVNYDNHPAWMDMEDPF